MQFLQFVLDFWAPGPGGPPWILQPRVLTRTLVDFWAPGPLGHRWVLVPWGPWDTHRLLGPWPPGTPMDFGAQGPFGPDGFLGSGLFGTSVDFWVQDF